MKKVKFIIITLFILLGLIIIVGNNSSEEEIELNYSKTNSQYIISETKYNIVDSQTDLVAMEIKDYGLVLIELYPDSAPITVENFKKLVEEDFYDGLTFHRVVKDFVIQTGDPTATGTGGSDETIKGEFSENGVDNDLSHERGIVSMARNSLSMDSASSQFFIVQKSATYLDGSYAAFGKVIDGLSVVDKIASVSVDSNDKPNKDVVITQICFIEKKEN